MGRTLSKADFKVLESFLASPKRPEGTLSLHELQGFLFAVASSPELIPPSAWQPMISNYEEIDFKNESEAKHVVGQIMTLYNKVNDDVLERTEKIPLGCDFLTDIDANFGELSTISQWSNGFMIGHDWLEDVWDAYLPEELDKEFGSSAMVLSFFSSRSLAEAYYLETTTSPRQRKPRVPFKEFAETIRDLFSAAMSSYANIGRCISEALIKTGSTKQ